MHMLQPPSFAGGAWLYLNRDEAGILYAPDGGDEASRNGDHEDEG